MRVTKDEDGSTWLNGDDVKEITIGLEN